jgi:Tfp pilus assembly protein PilN
MIRINLLPREEKGQRKAAFRFKAGEVAIPIALLAAVGLVIVGTVTSQRMSIASLAKSISDMDAQARAIAPQIERVNQLARERAELDLRLGVISRLEQGRTQTVRMMDELARCVPDHLWLTAANQNSPTSVTLDGMTLSNLVVSDFMSSLERSPLFADVQLELAERGETATRSVVRFRITAAVTPNEPAN